MIPDSFSYVTLSLSKGELYFFITGFDKLSLTAITK